MDLSGFDSPGFSGIIGSSNTAGVTSGAAMPSRSSGILSRIISGITQAPKYFLNTDIVNPTKELAASFTGNKTALQNAENDQTQTIGNTPGQALERLAGNTADLATTVLAPEAKAGLGAKVVQGAKIGAVAGGGSAAANGQNVIKGALEGAAVGGVANPVVQGLTSKVLKGVTPASTETADAATAATGGKIASNVNNHLQQTEAAAGGFNAGAKLPGSGPAGISLAESKNLSALAEKYNLPAGSAATRLKTIQGQLDTAGTNLKSAVENNNIPIDDDSKQAIVDDFKNRIAAQPNAKSLQSTADDLQDHFTGGTPISINGQVIPKGSALEGIVKDAGGNTGNESPVTDLKSLNEYKQNLDKAINYDKAGINPTAQQANSIFRQTINDHIGKIAPDVAEANKTFSELKQLETPTLMANNKVQSSSGGLYSRLLNNSLVKGTESKVASIGQKLTGGVAKSAETAPAAESTAATPGILSKVLSPSVAAPAAELANRAGVVAPAIAAGNPPAQNATLPPALEQQIAAGASGSGSSTTTPAPGTITYTQQELVNDINNDPKNAANYISLYKTLQPTTDTSAADQATISSLKDASSYLDTAEQELAALGGAKGPAEGLEADIPGLGQYLQPGAAAYNKTKVDVATSIAKALTGSKPAATVIKAYMESLPSVTDTPTVAAQKLANVRLELSNKASDYGLDLSGGSQQ